MNSRIKKALIIIASVVVVNAGLAFTKLYVGLSTNSICVMLDATNSFFDVIAGVITLISFILLLKPHKLGYGRAEYLATFLVAAFTLIFGFLFGYRSIGRLSMPEPVWSDALSIILMAIAVPIKIALAVFIMIANKKLDSPALKAVYIDSFLDSGITFAALLSFTLSSKLEYTVDAFVGIAISVVLCFSSIKLIFDYAKRLFVGSDEKEVSERIAEIVSRSNFVKSIADVTIHDYGYGKKIADVQVVFEETTVSEAINAVEEAKAEIKEKTGVTVNVVPVTNNNTIEGEDSNEQIR